MFIYYSVLGIHIFGHCCGAGTAIGELPPYFMARAARLPGYQCFPKKCPERNEEKSTCDPAKSNRGFRPYGDVSVVSTAKPKTSIYFLVQVPVLGPKLDAPVRNLLANNNMHACLFA